MSKLRDMVSNLVSLKRIIEGRGGVGAKPPTAVQLFVIFWKK